MPQEPKYLSPPAVAKRLGITAEKVCAVIRRGELRAYNLSLSRRPRWRILAEDVERWLESRANVPSAPAVRRRQIPRDVPKYI